MACLPRLLTELFVVERIRSLLHQWKQFHASSEGSERKDHFSSLFLLTTLQTEHFRLQAKFLLAFHCGRILRRHRQAFVCHQSQTTSQLSRVHRFLQNDQHMQVLSSDTDVHMCSCRCGGHLNRLTVLSLVQTNEVLDLVSLINLRPHLS